MIFGIAILLIGYTVFYWGYHHFAAPRYSLWTLFGFGNLFKNIKMPAGQPLQLPSTQQSTTNPGQ